MTDSISLMEKSMLNHMQRLNVISNNLANVNTPGFKRDIAISPGFESKLESAEANLQSGDAQKIKTVIDDQMGAIKYTGNPLDVAVESEGFLEVKGAGGTYYTRQGSMSLDGEGRLSIGGSYVVQGVNGEIRIDAHEPRIDKQGGIWDGDKKVGQLKVVDIADPRQLQRHGGGMYKSLASEGENTVFAEEQVRIRQGYIEASNVNQMNEMVNMIELMRQFEASQKLITNYDGLIDSAINTLGDL